MRLAIESFMKFEPDIAERAFKQSSTFPAQARNRAYDRFTTHDNFCEDQNAALPYLSRLWTKGRHAVLCM